MKTNRQKFIKNSALISSAFVSAFAAKASTDYGPAIWHSSCNANYYTSGNGHKFHVIHDMEGYYAGVISMFAGCSWTASSVHYLCNGKQDASSDSPAGEVSQMVRDAQYAWHACCWNTHSTGTEHEGFVSNPAWYTEAQYQASAGVTRHLASAFGWAKDRNHVVGHNAKSSSAWVSYANANLGINASCNTHSDPGAFWDWSHYMDLVNGGTPPPTVVTSPSIVTRSDGKVEAFVITSSTGDVQYREKASVGASWGSWVSLSGSGFYFVRGLPIDNGGVAVFGMGGGNILYKYLASSGAGVWSGWVSIAASGFTSIAPIMKTDGKMALIGCGNGTTIYYNEQTAIGPGASWTGWTDLVASSFYEVDGLPLPNGGAAAFGVGSGSAVFYKYKSSSTAAWTSWANLGGSGFSHISAVKESGGKLAFFGCAAGAGSPIYYQEQSAVGPAASWSGWLSLGGNGYSSISGVALPNDGLAVFGCTDNSTGSTEFYQKRDSGTSAWSGYVNLTASGVRRVAATADASGLMTTVMRGDTGGSLWETHQSDVNHWVAWANLGNALK
jgi:hypothetical protein